jgi:PAS domain-containing protein
MLATFRRTAASPSASWRELVHPDDISRVEESIRAHWADASRQYSTEFRMRRKDNTWQWNPLPRRRGDARRKRPRPAHGGHAHRHLGLKRAQADLETARVKAEASSRAKSEFLANMSHSCAPP